MRGRSSFVLICLSALMLGASPTLARTVTRQDPDDFEIAPDVHASAKSVFWIGERPGRLRITVRGELGPDYRLRALLDTRGGPRADLVMVTTVRNLVLVACSVHRRNGTRLDANCDADPFEAWWGVSRRDVAPSKPIRWRILAFGGPGLARVTDRAPDAGWYV